MGLGSGVKVEVGVEGVEVTVMVAVEVWVGVTVFSTELDELERNAK